MKAKIGLILGDPCGIGPEISLKLLANFQTIKAAQVLVIGNQTVWQQGQTQAGVEIPAGIIQHPAEFSRTSDAIVLLDNLALQGNEYQPGQASAAAGRFVLQALQTALDLAQNGLIDGLCFAPLNKHAMHLGGLAFEDELRFFVHYLGHEGPVGELNMLDNLCTSRVTSHVPLSEVSRLITYDSVIKSIRLVDETLRQGSYVRPRIAVAGLNPHAGEGGSFGREEIDVIGPAIEKAAEADIHATGPYSPDTVFRRARDGEFDAVVTMYHDQGQIAMKLLGFERGITVHGGLPFPITTPAHGTAFDIVGTGQANETAMVRAFKMACQMAGDNEE